MCKHKIPFNLSLIVGLLVSLLGCHIHSSIQIILQTSYHTIVLYHIANCSVMLVHFSSIQMSQCTSTDSRQKATCGIFAHQILQMLHIVKFSMWYMVNTVHHNTLSMMYNIQRNIQHISNPC